MSQDTDQKAVQTTTFIRRGILYVSLSLVFFLIGFVPMWLKYQNSSATLTTVEKQLKLANVQNLLANAAIDAQRGDYPAALQSTSDFYTALRVETDNPNSSDLSPTQIEGVMVLFDEQDNLITLLARGDKASVERLSNLYVSFLQVMM